MTRFYDVVQGGDEWHELRRGRSTASNFGLICANMGKAFGDPAKKYAKKKALERVTGRIEPGYTNVFMERGHEYEPIARERYEYETFYNVTNGGFYANDVVGDSPDGNVGDKGCIEIKCVIPNTHWERIEKGGPDLKYKWQIQGHLWVGQKEWCDFISYCPEFPENKQIHIARVERDEDLIEQMEERLAEFENLIKWYESLLR